MSKQGNRGISWTQETWNIVTGCTPVSAGCEHCYAASMAKRRIGDFASARKAIPGGSAYIERPFSEVRTHPERLERPLHWRKPRMVMVPSMGDAFHEQVPMGFVMQMLAVAYLCCQDIFQFLTKRQERAYKMLSDKGTPKWIFDSAVELLKKYRPNDVRRILKLSYNGMKWPLPNVWLGVTAENQSCADERIPILLQTPAAVRFVSIEPMLGPVDLTNLYVPDIPTKLLDGSELRSLHGGNTYDALKGERISDARLGYDCNKLGLVIIGAESGPGARECKIEWVESVVEQCRQAGVAVHIKQLRINGKLSKNPGDWPAHLRLREFPK